MSDLHQDLVRTFQQTGNAKIIANPERMAVDRIVRAVFYPDGRMRPDAIPLRWPGEWDGDHPTLGPVHIWFDATNNAVRAKQGAPASETDGTVVVTL